MRFSGSACALFLLAWALHHHSTQAARDESCDDHSMLSPACGFPLADPDSRLDSAAFCASTEILALQAGCFVCVDPRTCFVAYDEDHPAGTPEEDFDAETTRTTSNKSRAFPKGLLLVPIRDEHAGEKGIQISAQQAAAEAAVVAPPLTARGAMPEVSNWYFLIPACLALVSVGIALRSRMVQADIEFERVDGGDDDDEINPFCADPNCNPQQDDHDLEYGKPDESDGSDDDADKHAQH